MHLQFYLFSYSFFPGETNLTLNFRQKRTKHYRDKRKRLESKEKKTEEEKRKKNIRQKQEEEEGKRKKNKH